MNAPHQVEITKNGTTTCLATEGKFCDRNIAVNVNIDEMPIREAGIALGKEYGKTEAHDTFWDAFQAKGNRTDYEKAFYGQWWTGDNYNPKYIPAPVNAAYMYQKSNATGHLEVDTSKCTNMIAMFSEAKQVASIGTIDTRLCTSLASLFGYMDNLISIRKVILKNDGTQTFTDGSFWASRLKDIVIEGTIGNSLNIRICNSLSKDSLASFVDALSDNTSGKALTVSPTAKARFTDEEWASLIARKPNWTISLP